MDYGKPGADQHDQVRFVLHYKVRTRSVLMAVGRLMSC